MAAAQDDKPSEEAMDNLTPEQRLIPGRYRSQAYRKLPMTCELLHSLLEEAGRIFQKTFDVPDEKWPAVARIVNATFYRVRDRVTQPLRTEQMRLLREIGEANSAKGVTMYPGMRESIQKRLNSPDPFTVTIAMVGGGVYLNVGLNAVSPDHLEIVDGKHVRLINLAHVLTISINDE